MSIPMCFVGSFLFAFSAFELALAHEWAGLVITVVSPDYSLPEWVRIRALLRHSRELAPVRAARAVETRPGGADDEAAGAAGRRRAAWARVRHDVFLILSNPSLLKRPSLLCTTGRTSGRVDEARSCRVSLVADVHALDSFLEIAVFSALGKVRPETDALPALVHRGVPRR